MWEGTTPLLRAHLTPPAGVTPVEAEPRGRRPGDIYAQPEGRSFAFNIASPFSTTHLTYKDAKGTPVELVVSTRVQATTTPVLTHSSCFTHNIRLKAVAGGAVLLYVAASCEEKPKSYLITVYHSADGKRVSPAAEFEIPKRPAKMADATKAIGTFTVSGTSGDTARFELYQAVMPAEPNKFAANVGIGVTYASYTEDRLGDLVQNVKESQICLTPKLAVVYRLSPRWDLGASGFGSLISLTSSSTPAGLGSVRYFGFNTRIGYNLGLSWFGGQWKLLVGTYAWGMMTAADFGIPLLSGPQVVLLFGKETSGHHGFSTYFKFAPTGESITGLKLSNREVAGGVGYRLSAYGGPHRYDLTLDVSDANFGSDDGFIHSHLNTYTLGLQVSL
jgi:hypothetical protein